MKMQAVIEKTTLFDVTHSQSPDSTLCCRPIKPASRLLLHHWPCWGHKRAAATKLLSFRPCTSASPPWPSQPAGCPADSPTRPSSTCRYAPGHHQAQRTSADVNRLDRPASITANVQQSVLQIATVYDHDSGSGGPHGHRRGLASCTRSKCPSYFPGVFCKGLVLKGRVAVLHLQVHSSRAIQKPAILQS